MTQYQYCTDCNERLGVRPKDEYPHAVHKGTEVGPLCDGCAKVYKEMERWSLNK